MVLIYSRVILTHCVFISMVVYGNCRDLRLIKIFMQVFHYVWLQSAETDSFHTSAQRLLCCKLCAWTDPLCERTRDRWVHGFDSLLRENGTTPFEANQTYMHAGERCVCIGGRRLAKGKTDRQHEKWLIITGTLETKLNIDVNPTIAYD